MGKGIDLARAVAPEHAAVLDDLKDQLLIVCMKRLSDFEGEVHIHVDEIDDTGGDLLSFSVGEDIAGGLKMFTFKLGKKS